MKIKGSPVFPYLPDIKSSIIYLKKISTWENRRRKWTEHHRGFCKRNPIGFLKNKREKAAKFWFLSMRERIETNSTAATSEESTALKYAFMLASAFYFIDNKFLLEILICNNTILFDYFPFKILKFRFF